MANRFEILGMGNPLLDISADVPMELLKKYDLRLDNAILAEEKHLPLFKELTSKYDVKYIAGGACQNSIRVAQWMLQKPGSTAFIGSVGQDMYGLQLAKCAQADGVSVYYSEDPTTPTGTCAVLINEKERSLIANLSAANNYKVSHLDTCTLVWKSASIYYVSGFFLTVSPDTMLQVGRFAYENDRKFCMNLSAEFLVQFFEKPMMEVMPYVDILFGNESEALAFGKQHKYQDLSVKAIACKISELPRKRGTKRLISEIAKPGRSRLVVFTQGPDAVIVAKDGKAMEFPVPKVSNIVDTNGAGDAFAGGFLAAESLNLPLLQCVEAGIYASTVILGVSGTELNGTPSLTLATRAKI